MNLATLKLDVDHYQIKLNQQKVAEKANFRINRIIKKVFFVRCPHNISKTDSLLGITKEEYFLRRNSNSQQNLYPKSFIEVKILFFTRFMQIILKTYTTRRWQERTRWDWWRREESSGNMETICCYNVLFPLNIKQKHKKKLKGKNKNFHNFSKANERTMAGKRTLHNNLWSFL